MYIQEDPGEYHGETWGRFFIQSAGYRDYHYRTQG